ncbi:MoxR-like ATPase [Chitinivorax tropicus]|uniref:MoxR-like ATPase n=1 Tax=Chitinivorax tropicus TaxID=714531 RepID=A0A840MJR8_9PROT|nr:MoxR family ATPase [Chitinivorax tropicus]MBB5016942.1 MoxR-like ATPase [Chitinivorax tropicus]
MMQDPTFESRLSEAVKALDAMREAIGRALVGQRDVVDQTLIALLAGGHVLIEGVPGLGKTLLVKSLAKTFSGDFRRIQFTPDLMPSDVTGHTLYDPATGHFSTRKGPVFTNLLLADEINRAPAKTQAALLEVMQERQVTIEGQAHQLDAPFMVLATENPIDQEGTYPLPEAQLDRFLLKIQIDYPSLEEETRLVKQVTQGAIGEQLDVNVVPTLIKPATVLALQEMAARVMVDDRVMDYAVRLARATRSFARLTSGAGPRGAIALVRAGRACALLAGRAFATPDDIKQVALPTLRHRVVPSPEAEIEGTHADQLLLQLLNEVEAPRQ